MSSKLFWERFLFFLNNYVHIIVTDRANNAILTAGYLRNVFDAKGRWELVSVSKGDLVGGSFQCDLCPQEKTVPKCVPVKTKVHFKPDKYFTSFTFFTLICFWCSMKKVHSVCTTTYSMGSLSYYKIKL